MINKISFLGKITPEYNLQTQRSTVTKPMECDCFIKSTPENAFIKWAEDNNFTQSSAKDVFSQENLLGKGFSNSVYRIDGNDNFVLRVTNCAKNHSELDLSKYDLQDTEDKKLKGNYGQCIATLKGDGAEMPKIEVLRRQNGIANANPPSSVIYNEDGSLRAGEAPYEARERKEHYAQCLQILADMPQEAYDKVVKQLSEIGELGYKFDYYNSNNFMLDAENRNIGIIDLEKEDCKHRNDLGNALLALSDLEYLDTYMSKYDSTPTSREEQNLAFKNTIAVIDKYVKALKNNGVKFSKKCYEPYNQLLDSMPMSFYLGTINNLEKCQKLIEMGVLD